MEFQEQCCDRSLQHLFTSIAHNLKIGYLQGISSQANQVARFTNCSYLQTVSHVLTHDMYQLLKTVTAKLLQSFRVIVYNCPFSSKYEDYQVRTQIFTSKISAYFLCFIVSKWKMNMNDFRLNSRRSWQRKKIEKYRKT